MRFLLLYLLLIACVQANTITLPIEVLGRPGHIEQIELNLNSDPSLATGLRLRMHGLTYDNKASIKINDSEWIDINNKRILLPKTQTAFWGIGGSMSTLDVFLPLDKGIIQSNNIIQFRFNDLDYLTVGYRVLKIEVASQSRNLLLSTKFVHDNPRNWKPISTNLADIIAGREIWFNATLRDGGVDKPILQAKCSDCHAYDGADLKYFNYSDKSIIARSIFHEISEGDAKKIASYIRSLKIPYQNNGRPWHPPYQPGLSIDRYPVEDWAAGAGLDAVLNDDLAMLDYIFPTGPTNGVFYGDGLYKLDFKKTLNTREIPLPIQLPDWNHWLPQIHPKDAYPEIYNDKFPYLKIHTDLRAKLKGKSPLEAGIIFNKSKHVWDGANKTGLIEPNKTNSEYAEFIYKQKGVAHWRVVKTWELMTEFKLENLGKKIFGNLSSDRRWFHGETFMLAPHMLGTPHGKDGPFYTESMQWYQLQMVLNDGNRNNASIVPIDWGYLHALNFSSWNNPIDMPTYGIAILNSIKGGEVSENGLPVDSKKGWNPYDQKVDSVASRYFGPQYNQIDIKLRRQVAEVLIDAWADKALSYSKNQYQNSEYFQKDNGNNFIDYINELKKQSIKLGVNVGVINKLDQLLQKLN